jgi:hypothetical protein
MNQLINNNSIYYINRIREKTLYIHTLIQFIRQNEKKKNFFFTKYNLFYNNKQN